MTQPIGSAKTPRPEPSAPGRLLATLLSQNTLVQPEVALTRATQFLLALPGAARALDDLVVTSGLVPESNGYWLTEVRGGDGGRTDLEYVWGDPAAAHVVVEAKVGHFLGGDQVDAYRSRLGEYGLLAVLVPATRRREGDRVVDELSRRYGGSGDRVAVALWTWDDVVDALETAMPGQCDVAQLKGLVEAAGALDIRPFSAGELVTSDRSRFADLWSILDDASFLGYPAQSGGYFERHRFYPVGAYDAYFSVGIGRSGRNAPEPWCWVRIWSESHLGRAQQEAVRAHRSDCLEDGDDLIVPLVLEPDLSGYELTEALRAQLELLAQQVRARLREMIDHDDRTLAQVDAKVLAPLHGMRTFEVDELLDSNPDRRLDIESVLTQVSKHIFAGHAVRWSGPDSAFEKRNWIKLDPYQSHLSIGIARRGEAASPRPWAWLSIESATHQADAVLEALRTAFPGQLNQTPDGWALPLRITEGDDGVAAFNAVVEQIDEARAAILRRLQGHP